MPESRDTVTDFFQGDHRRLDDIFARYQEARSGGDGDPLVHCEEFITGLRRHIAWEEDHLFPLFEQRSGMDRVGPTEVMRREHRHIEQMLENLRHGVGEGQLDDLPAAEEELTDLLAQHNVKEEQVLYPSLDSLLSDEDRTELFRRLTE